MAKSVPIIEGKVVEVKIRKQAARCELEKILALLRREARIPPYKLRHPQTQRERSHRDVALYLATYYSSLTGEDLAAYFAVSEDHVNRVSTNPLYCVELPLLEHFQSLIEDTFISSIAYSVEFGRPLYIEEVDELTGPACDYFTPTEWALSPKESELLTALFGLQEYYENRGETFDLDDYWGPDEEYDQWNLCEYNP